MSPILRWLGVAGLELKAGNQVLAIDPFFTRPTFLQMLRPVTPDTSLVAEKLPLCNAVLVTHSHYDHLMDVPAVLNHTGAVAYGSANTCHLLHLAGVPEAQIKEIGVGDQLSLGSFQVEVIPGQHSAIPYGHLFNGSLPPDLHLPLHVWDYRMDICLGYAISVPGKRLLVCAAQPQPADILLSVAQESKEYYLKMLQGVNPQVFMPIHWDNFTRPLKKPLHRFARPGRLHLSQITRLCRQILPYTKVIVPVIFTEYPL